MNQIDYADVQGLVRFGYGNEERLLCAGSGEEFRCGEIVDTLGSGNHSCYAKAASKDCDEYRGHGAWP